MSKLRTDEGQKLKKRIKIQLTGKLQQKQNACRFQFFGLTTLQLRSYIFFFKSFSQHLMEKKASFLLLKIGRIRLRLYTHPLPTSGLKGVASHSSKNGVHSNSQLRNCAQPCSYTDAHWMPEMKAVGNIINVGKSDNFYN